MKKNHGDNNGVRPIGIVTIIAAPGIVTVGMAKLIAMNTDVQDDDHGDWRDRL